MFFFTEELNSDSFFLQFKLKCCGFNSTWRCFFVLQKLIKFTTLQGKLEHFWRCKLWMEYIIKYKDISMYCGERCILYVCEWHLRSWSPKRETSDMLKSYLRRVAQNLWLARTYKMMTCWHLCRAFMFPAVQRWNHVNQVVICHFLKQNKASCPGLSLNNHCISTFTITTRNALCPS